MYINLNKKYIEKNKKKMEKESIKEMGNDGKGSLLNIDVEDIVEYEFDNGKINLNSDSNLGYVSLDYQMSDGEMMEIVRHMRNKANKIKELIKLAD